MLSYPAITYLSGIKKELFSRAFTEDSLRLNTFNYSAVRNRAKQTVDVPKFISTAAEFGVKMNFVEH